MKSLKVLTIDMQLITLEVKASTIHVICSKRDGVPKVNYLKRKCSLHKTTHFEIPSVLMTKISRYILLLRR